MANRHKNGVNNSVFAWMNEMMNEWDNYIIGLKPSSFNDIVCKEELKKQYSPDRNGSAGGGRIDFQNVDFYQVF